MAKDERLEVLRRLAVADVSDGRGLASKTKALAELVQLQHAGTRVPITRRALRDELGKVIGTGQLGGRAGEAVHRAASALKLLDTPRPAKTTALDPNSVAPPGHWHPSPGSGWAALDAGDTVADRERWRRNLERYRPPDVR